MYYKQQELCGPAVKEARNWNVPQKKQKGHKKEKWPNMTEEYSKTCYLIDHESTDTQKNKKYLNYY